MQIPDALLHYFCHFLRFQKYITIKRYQSTPSHFCPQHLPKWNWKLLNRLVTKHLTGSFVLGTTVNSLVQILFSAAYRQLLVFPDVSSSHHFEAAPPLISIISHPNSGFCIYPSKHFLFISSNILPLYQWLYLFLLLYYYHRYLHCNSHEFFRPQSDMSMSISSIRSLKQTPWSLPTFCSILLTIYFIQLSLKLPKVF